MLGVGKGLELGVQRNMLRFVANRVAQKEQPSCLRPGQRTSRPHGGVSVIETSRFQRGTNPHIILERRDQDVAIDERRLPVAVSATSPR